MPPKEEAQEQMRVFAERADAQEHQRRLLQGLGRRITSFVTAEGVRVVRVGGAVYQSKVWRTFHEFLADYIQIALTQEWGRSELSKPESERHPLLIWWAKSQDFAAEQVGQKRGPVKTDLMPGATEAYLQLAYSLYLSAHNAGLPELLLKRLRNRDQFEGAVYEAFVVGLFAKAGFTIEFEDEGDSSSSHCEFIAAHGETKRRFSVEVKAIGSSSKRAGASVQPPKVRGLFRRALSKSAAHPRIVFIDLNRAHHPLGPGNEPIWRSSIESEINRAEGEMLVDGSPAPPAYLFVTNRGAMLHDLDRPAVPQAWLTMGFKIPNYPVGKRSSAMIDMYRARKEHIEAHVLMKALETGGRVPATFDGRLPEEAFGLQTEPRLLVGNAYLLPPPPEGNKEVVGVLTSAIVLEPERNAYGVYRLADGKHVICTTPLTDVEMDLYRASPATFFGVVRSETKKGFTDPLDAFDFLHETYSQTPREKLLEFMADWPNQDLLQKLDQARLSEHYCAQMATQIWREHQARIAA